MLATIERFNDRVAEIEVCFSAIQQLYDKQETMKSVYSFNTDDFLKILKANALLMIYNLVESSVMGGILEIYDQLASEGHSYKSVRKEMQNIWINFKFNQAFDKSSHYNSYKTKALEIIEDILESKPLMLDRKAAGISGNLDADKIREIFKEHGIVYKLQSPCRGGAVLETVKNKRNELAHGSLSFMECGREYTVDDLERIKDETVYFLNDILDGMKQYFYNKTYMCLR